MTGKCLCGAVTFVAEDVETHHHACHCGMCLRWSGGAPFFGARVHGVAFTGVEHLARHASSPWAERGFCRTCGSHLFYFLKPNQSYSMSVGAFDDPSPFVLALEIFIDQKPAGYAFAGEHPRMTEAEAVAAFTPGD